MTKTLLKTSFNFILFKFSLLRFKLHKQATKKRCQALPAIGNRDTVCQCFQDGRMFFGGGAWGHGLVHFSLSAACLCLRCCSKLVVLLHLVATAFKQTLQRGAGCSVSDAPNLTQFQITEDTFPFFRVRSSLLTNMFVYQARRGEGGAHSVLSELWEPSRQGLADNDEKIDFH